MNSASLGPRLCVVLLAAGVLLLEISLREFGDYGRRVVPDVDGRYGIVLLPNQQVVSRNGQAAIRINSEGFRDRPWGPPEPDSSAFRVAVIGDSMAYGSDVDGDRIWPRRLEQRLAAHLELRGDPRRAEVLNASRPGQASPQKLLVYEDSIRPRRPDVVVYALAPHDIQRLPEFEVEPRRGPLRDFVLRTALYDFAVREVVRGRIDRIGSDGNEPAWSRHNREVLEDPFTEQQRPHWAALRDRLEALRLELADRGASLLIVPNPILHPRSDPRVVALTRLTDTWPAPLEACRVDVFEDFRNSLFASVQAFAEGGVPPDRVWSDPIRGVLSPAAAALVERDATAYAFLPDDLNHLSPTGHDLLASLVFEALVDRIGD